VAHATKNNISFFITMQRYASVGGISRHRLSVCLSVCVSVTRRYCIKTAKRRITQTTSRDSPGTTRRKTAENFNRLSRVHERNRQTTDRLTTDDRRTGDSI